MAVLVKGIDNPVDLATPATHKLKIRAVRDFISLEDSEQSVERAYMDKMSPEARATLYVILTDLEAAIANAV